MSTKDRLNDHEHVMQYTCQRKNIAEFGLTSCPRPKGYKEICALTFLCRTLRSWCHRPRHRVFSI